MSKKVLISIIVVIGLGIAIYLCAVGGQNQQDEWTNSSQKLLDMKKMPKKKLYNND